MINLLLNYGYCINRRPSVFSWSNNSMLGFCRPLGAEYAFDLITSHRKFRIGLRCNCLTTNNICEICKVAMQNWRYVNSYIECLSLICDLWLLNKNSIQLN